MNISESVHEQSRLRFEKDTKLMGKRIVHPLTERIMQRYPRVASLLAAVGAKGMPEVSAAHPSGSLAVMMAASGSIDFNRRQKKRLRFQLRQMH